MKCFFSYFLTLIILSSTPLQTRGTNLTISDKVRTNVDFYFRKFNVYPSKLVTINYAITFNRTNIKIQCGDYNNCVVSLDIYTTEDDLNLQKNRSINVFGQLRNENLHTPMRHRSKPYRYTTCKLDEVDSDMLRCEGRAMIQDYKPRDYGFSFGYDCMYSERPSLRGLSFNFTISGQTNKTTCIKIPEVDDGFFMCHQIYNYASLPNMIGNLIKDTLNEWKKQDQLSRTLTSTLGLILSSDGRLCHKHTRAIWCRILYPKCDLDEEIANITHPFKETCDEFFEACSENIMMGLNILHDLGSHFSR